MLQLNREKKVYIGDPSLILSIENANELIKVFNENKNEKGYYELSTFSAYIEKNDELIGKSNAFFKFNLPIVAFVVFKDDDENEKTIKKLFTSYEASYGNTEVETYHDIFISYRFKSAVKFGIKKLDNINYRLGTAAIIGLPLEE